MYCNVQVSCFAFLSDRFVCCAERWHPAPEVTLRRSGINLQNKSEMLRDQHIKLIRLSGNANYPNLPTSNQCHKNYAQYQQYLEIWLLVLESNVPLHTLFLQIFWFF